MSKAQSKTNKQTNKIQNKNSKKHAYVLPAAVKVNRRIRRPVLIGSKTRKTGIGFN